MPLTIPDQTIALQTKVPDSLNTLNSIMNFKNAQLQNQANTADLNEKTQLRNLANDPSLLNDDGTRNQDAYAEKARQVAPTLGAANAQASLGNQAQQTANKQAQFKLHGDYTATALQTATGALNDPRINPPPGTPYNDQAAAEALEEARAQMVEKGVPPAQAAIAVAPYFNNVHTPGAVPQMLKNTIAGQLSAPSQVAAATPSGPVLNSGQQQQQFNTNPMAGPTGPVTGVSVKNQLAPGQQDSVSTDANGNPIVINRNPAGSVTNVGGAPVNGQVTPIRVTPNTETPQSIATLQDRRTQVNTAASTVPDQHFNNREIIGLLDKASADKNFLSPTGSNANTIAKISSTIGIPISGDFATDANKISHYLALQTQSNEKAMGVHSDAGAALSGAAMGSITQTPASLRNAVAVNDAGVSGLQFHNQGMEAAVQSGGIPAIRTFQNQWSQNYDPNAMRLYNANKNGDTQEAQAVMKELGGTNSPKFKALIQKAANLERLSSQGHL